MCFKMVSLRRVQKQLYRLFSRDSSLKSDSKMQYLETPDKSEGDKKLYRALRLPNGLRAMLISDAATEHAQDGTANQLLQEIRSTSCKSSSNCSMEPLSGKLAACAVLVGVGSFSEPQQYQGLAHLLEHMIFMGSEKYPAENAFDAFVTKCGGFSNATTENEHTAYYFEVEELHLDKSLDIFMNLIKAPLMLQESMARERSAVQSEFEQTYMLDEVRRDQILASLTADGYPQGTFGWGNLKSLKDNVQDKELYEALHAFHRKYYVANSIVVCLQAQMALDDLEQLLLSHCSDIASGDKKQLVDYSKLSYEKAFRSSFYNEVYVVKPVENICKLELTWVLPSMFAYYRSKPDMFFSQLLGYEGEGSLCAYLRKRLWCMNLMAGVDESSFDSNSIYAFFNVCIYLTDEGFQHLDEVFAATFAWLKLIAHCDKLQQSFAEAQQLAANNFRYQVEPMAADNVQNVAHSFWYLPTKDVLTGTQLYYEYDEAALQLLKKHLGKFKFNIMISSHLPYENLEYTHIEPWFGTHYTSIAIPQKWIDMWHSKQIMHELHLPKPNPFIASDFRLHWLEAGSPHLSKRPKALLQNELCELWFRQDDTFLLPDGFINIYFITPLIRHSVKHCMMGALLTYLVEFQIAEQLYPALEAGLSYRLYAADKGLVLRVFGYNEKLPLLLDIILQVLQSLELDNAQLLSFKEFKKRIIFNGLISADTLNMDLRLSLLENQRFDLLEKYNALDHINLDDIQQFKANFYKQMYIQMLVQGNFTEAQALQLMQKILKMYNSVPITDPEALENRLVQLPQGIHYLRVKTLNYEDNNSIVTNYYQIGPTSLRHECLMDLMEYIADEPFFHQLRTLEQLCYSLSIYPRVSHGVLAYIISVNTQEHKFPADYVDQRIEAFRARIPDIVAELSDEDFLAVRESLINGKMLVDAGLHEEVGRNWQEIVTKEYFFNRLDKQVQTLRGISKADLLSFLADYEQNDLRKLSVQVVGQNINIEDLSTSSASSAAASTASSAISSQDSKTGHKQRSGSLAEMIEEIQQSISDEQRLFQQMRDKIKLEFIANKDDPTHITDIAAFKKKLQVYPLIITNPKVNKK